jgi:hypothetical protein
MISSLIAQKRISVAPSEQSASDVPGHVRSGITALAGPWPLYVQDNLIAHVGGGQAGAGPALRGLTA